MEPHVCRYCLGRIVSTAAKDEDRIYRCTNCGAQGASGSARCVCACGLKIGGKDAGMRCVVNATPTPECMSEIIAKEMK